MAALGVREGRADAALVIIVSLGLAGGVTTVLVDRRVLARRAAGRDGAGRSGDEGRGPQGLRGAGR